VAGLESKRGAASEDACDAEGSSMHSELGQNPRVVIRVSIDIVVAVAEYGDAVRAHSNIIRRDHRMRDPKNGTRLR
jgi:hypothetical protein